MKNLKLLAALLALAIGLAGCGKGSSASSSKPEKMLDGDNMIASSSAKQEYTEPEDVTYMRLLAGEDEYRACVLYLGGSYGASVSWISPPAPGLVWARIS